MAIPLKRLWALTLCAGLLLSCAGMTPNQQRAAGGAAGAATGAILGSVIGGSGKDVWIGAAAGGLAGLLATEILIQTQQSRSADEDAAVYGYTGGTDSPTLTINEAAAEPSTVRPGDTVKLSTDYSLRLPSSTPTATIEETFAFRKADEAEAQPYPSEAVARDAGGWVVEAEFEVPNDAPPGAYMVTHHVGIENGLYDERVTAFNVVR